MKPKIVVADRQEVIKLCYNALYAIFIRKDYPYYKYIILSPTFVEETTRSELIEVNLKMTNLTSDEIELVMWGSGIPHSTDFPNLLLRLLFKTTKLPECVSKAIYSVRYPTLEQSFFKISDNLGGLTLSYKIKEGRIKRQFDKSWVKNIGTRLSLDWIEWVEMVNKRISECPEAENYYISFAKLQSMIKQLDFQIKKELLSLYEIFESYLAEMVAEAWRREQQRKSGQKLGN